MAVIINEVEVIAPPPPPDQQKEITAATKPPGPTPLDIFQVVRSLINRRRRLDAQ